MGNIALYQGYVIKSIGKLEGFIHNNDSIGLCLTTQIIDAKIFREKEFAQKFIDESIFKDNQFEIIPFCCQFKY